MLSTAWYCMECYYNCRIPASNWEGATMFLSQRCTRHCFYKQASTDRTFIDMDVCEAGGTVVALYYINTYAYKHKNMFVLFWCKRRVCSRELYSKYVPNTTISYSRVFSIISEDEIVTHIPHIPYQRYSSHVLILNLHKRAYYPL